MQCGNNIRQIGVALQTYEGNYRTFPPGFISQTTGVWSGQGNDGIPEIGTGWSAFAMILPFIEQTALHQSIDFKKPISDPINQPARSTRISTYRCPSDVWTMPVAVWPTTIPITDLGANSYVGCLGGGIRRMPPTTPPCMKSSPLTVCSTATRRLLMRQSWMELRIRLGWASELVCFRRLVGPGDFGGENRFLALDGYAARSRGWGDFAATDHGLDGTRANWWTERADGKPRWFLGQSSRGMPFRVDGCVRSIHLDGRRYLSVQSLSRRNDGQVISNNWNQ